MRKIILSLVLFIVAWRNALELPIDGKPSASSGKGIVEVSRPIRDALLTIRTTEFFIPLT